MLGMIPGRVAIICGFGIFPPRYEEERAMEPDEAQAMRAKIAELTEELARRGSDGHTSHRNFILAHAQALESAFIALALELREEMNVPDLIERISTRLTYTASPALRRLNDPDSGRSADAIDSLAGRLDHVEKRPKFQK